MTQGLRMNVEPFFIFKSFLFIPQNKSACQNVETCRFGNHNLGRHQDILISIIRTSSNDSNTCHLASSRLLANMKSHFSWG